jgi:hypothetical protein
MSAWHERNARNQALFREVNELIEQFPEPLVVDRRDRLICECANSHCRQQIELTRAEYERVRGYASRFIVALNHENPETESIVKQNERFAVVETYAGAASQIARETNPRAQQRMRRAQAEVVMRGDSLSEPGIETRLLFPLPPVRRVG